VSNYYSRPRIALAISEDLHFTRVSSFFRPPIFRRLWADFRETLPPDAVCSEIDYVLWECSYVPPKNSRGTPNFRHLRTQSRNFEPHHFVPCWVALSISTADLSVPTWWGSHRPRLRSVIHGTCGGAGKRSNRYNFGYIWQLATRCLILGVGFPGRPIRRRHCCGQNCSTRATVKLGIVPHSSVITPCIHRLCQKLYPYTREDFYS